MLLNFNSDLILSSEMDSPLHFSHVFPAQWRGQEQSPSWQVPPFLQGLGLHLSGTAKKIRWFIIHISQSYISKNDVHRILKIILYWCRRVISINTEITRINSFAFSAITTSSVHRAITTPSKSVWFKQAKMFADPPFIQWFSSITWKSCTATTTFHPITSLWITATHSSRIWDCWKNSV